MNVTKKILSKHLVSGELKPGEEIAVRVENTLTQDATGTMAYMFFEAMGVPKVKTMAVSFADHKTVQQGSGAEGGYDADDHTFLQDMAGRYGATFSKAGNGICHQVFLERFAYPGGIVLGSDSHTPTAGGMGMIGIGVGGLDVAKAMAGKPFYLICPKVIKIHLTGRLNNWVSAKDVVLTVLKKFGVKGNVNCVFEYGGKGVKTLSVPERATIANMGAECGVTFSIFPSDERTREFLRAQGRISDWAEVKADDGAKYADRYDLDLSDVEPMIACPHSPGNVDFVRNVAKKNVVVNQVCIGSCTNSSFRDLMVVAGILEKRNVHYDVTLVISPGSRQVLQMITENGALGVLTRAGARIAEPACGPCIGMGFSPITDGVSVRTFNRNFLGRSGTESAQVYLASPETAVAAAIFGQIVSPTMLDVMGFSYPEIFVPDRFTVNDGLLIPPSVKCLMIRRGPNIVPIPKSVPMPSNFNGTVVIKVGDNTTTDHIMPAGSLLKYRSNVLKYAEYLFHYVDPNFYRRVAGLNGGIGVIVAGQSYGQGSSREHAALCPMALGIKAVIARSFERIHRNNLVNFGIIPFVFENENDWDAIEQDVTMRFDGLRDFLGGDSEKFKIVLGDGKEIFVICDLSQRERNLVLAGGELA